MSEQVPKQAFVEVSQEQAEHLSVMELSEAQLQVSKLAGRVILSKEIYGVVQSDEEEGPLAVYSLSGNTIGDKINQDRNEGQYPSLIDAQKALHLEDLAHEQGEAVDMIWRESLQGEYMQIEIPSFSTKERNPLNAESINGNVIAVLELPEGNVIRGGVAVGREMHAVAIVDYGPGALAEGGVAVVPKMPRMGEYATGMQRMHGNTEDSERFGIVAYNYTPSDHMSSYASIPVDEAVTVGRNDQELNRRLGLNDRFDATDALSLQHVTLQIHNEGYLSIVDHSENGTILVHAGNVITDKTATGSIGQ